MENKSWRGVNQFAYSKKYHVETFKPLSPIRNTVSMRANFISGKDKEDFMYKTSSILPRHPPNELNEKIYELNNKISSLKEQLTDINLSNIHLKNLLRQKAEENNKKKERKRNEYRSPLGESEKSDYTSLGMTNGTFSERPCVSGMSSINKPKSKPKIDLVSELK